MTIKEAAALLGLSEITLSRNFLRTQESLKKKGILIMREGRGQKADYTIEYLRLNQLQKEE